MVPAIQKKIIGSTRPIQSLVIFPVPVLPFAGVKVQELCISFLLNNLIIFVVNSNHTSHIIRVRFTQFIIVSPYKAFDTYKIFIFKNCFKRADCCCLISWWNDNLVIFDICLNPRSVVIRLLVRMINFIHQWEIPFESKTPSFLVCSCFCHYCSLCRYTWFEFCNDAAR